MTQRRLEPRRHARSFGIVAALLCTGCEADRTPPPTSSVGGLPVSGSFADARRAGFTNCFNPDATRIRCRRHGVMLAGQGPYEAAVDLLGSGGAGGFDEITLWHDRDAYAVYKIRDALKGKGWRYCFTGSAHMGDQAIYSRPDMPVIVSMDLSYWGKRRLRLIPVWKHKEARCTPKYDLT